MNPTLARGLKHISLFWLSLVFAGISVYDIEFNEGGLTSYILLILGFLMFLAYVLTHFLYVPQNVPQFRIKNDSEGLKSIAHGNGVEMIWNFRLHITNDSRHDAKEIKIHFIKSASRIHFPEDLEYDPEMYVTNTPDFKTIAIPSLEEGDSKTIICQAREQGRQGDISYNSTLMLPTYLTSLQLVIEYKNEYNEGFVSKFIRRDNIFKHRELTTLPYEYQRLLT